MNPLVGDAEGNGAEMRCNAEAAASVNVLCILFNLFKDMCKPFNKLK